MSAPGEEHKGLATLVGDWDVKFRFADGDKMSPEAKGKATYREILGGRFIVEEVKVELNQNVFEWMGVYGYDKHKKAFTASWFDNHDTNTETAEGSFDNDSKTLTLKGKQLDPRSGQTKDYKWLMKWEDKNRKVTVTMLVPDKSGKDAKVMEIVQTKVS